MPTNLTGSLINATYEQLLHVDGGPAATEKVVYSGTGVATALKVGTQSVSVDNIQFDGNTISSTNTDGNIVLTPNGTGVVTTDNLSFDGNTIATTDTNGNLVLAPNGTGSVSISNINVTGGAISGVTFTGTFDGITAITSTSFFTDTLDAGLTLAGQALTADGTDTDIDINLVPKGTGEVNISKVDIDSGSVLATTDLGYATGSGGTVTQATSKSTGVTLNAVSGKITMHNEQLNRNTGVSFTLTNSAIAATDVLIANISTGATANAYSLTVDAVADGSCRFHLHNLLSGSDLSEAIGINFVVIKGAHS